MTEAEKADQNTETPGATTSAGSKPLIKHSGKMRLKRALVRVRRRLPPGVRFVVGIILIGLGILGFLPILGFWMIPLGIAVALLDLVPLWHKLRGR